MNDRIRLRLGRTLLVAGGLLVAVWAAVMIDAWLFQSMLARRLKALGGRASNLTLREAVETRRAARASGLVGRLEIPSVGLTTMVVEGTTGRSLRRGVGHVKGTAFPGERGNVGLAGHRDTYFRKLKNLSTGDEIRLSTPDGRFTYKVDTILIVKPNRGDLLRATSQPSLTLVTCYPFYWVGPAPKRFVVRATRSASAGSEAPRANARAAPGSTPRAARSAA